MGFDLTTRGLPPPLSFYYFIDILYFLCYSTSLFNLYNNWINILYLNYASIHNTFRKKNSDTRVSIDTTLFVGNHEPHKDRIKEYRNKIPNVGKSEFVDAGQYETDKPADKVSTYSHYTSKVLKIVKF